MKNIKSTLTFTTALLLAASLVSGQTVSEVSTRQSGDLLIIHYDLNGPAAATYNVYPSIITRDGRTIQPQSLSGDHLSVMPGRGHVITWQVLNDLPVLEGEVAVQLVAVKVSQSNPQQISVSGKRGGPGNAFLSMLLPGLGDVFVNDPGKTVKVKPGYIMVGYIASLGMAYMAKMSEIESYQNYQRASQQHDMDRYYEQAMYYRENAAFMAFLAGSIWVADVVRVAVKGAENRRAAPIHHGVEITLNGGLHRGCPSVVLACKF